MTLSQKFFNRKQAQQKVNHCSRNKKKGKKGRAKKNPKIEKSKNSRGQSIKVGRLIEFYRKHTYSYKKLCCHINSLFSSPHQLDFNMLLLFSTKNVKQGRKLKLTYLYACWIMHAYEALLAKVSRKAFNVGEVWNLVCCHSNKTVKLILWSTFCRILLQRIKHF